MHLLKNLIDNLPLRLSNAENYLAAFYHTQLDENGKRIKAGSPLPDDGAFIKQYLLNEDGFKALENLINEKTDKEIILEDKDNAEIKLTLKDLTRLKEKGVNTHTEADYVKFREQLNKFKLIISKDNQDIRKEVEAKQDEMHKARKIPTPLPSSALYPGSIANTELLLQID